MNDPDMTEDSHRRKGGAKASGAPEGGAGRGASLLDGILRRAGRMAGGTLDLALDVATASAMFGDYRLRDLLANTASPERLEAMAEAGHFLRDARQTAGLSLAELSERLDLGDEDVLRGVEEGRSILPLDIMLRAASLLARHDPIPFLIKFLRSYNPGLEATLEQWGVMALPKNFERERRFINLYRQHDFLRDLTDEEHQRFIEYMDASTNLVVQMMQRESAAPPLHRARGSRASSRSRSSSARSAAKPASRQAKKPARKAAKKASRPVVRKVKPRQS
jgi:transcriptional regulator with XRE-family HTH domain